MDKIWKEGVFLKRKGKRLLSLLLFVLLSLTACGSSTFTDEAVLKINEQEIMKSQYMIYLYTTTQSFLAMAGEEVWTMDFDGQTADELVEERTISTIQSVIAAKEYAAENDITMTEEQKAEAKEATAQFLETVPAADLAKMGAEESSLLPLMEDSYLFSLVQNEIAAECDIDEEDLAAYYAENKEAIKDEYTTVRVQSILLDDAEKAEEAAKRAKAGEDFTALFKEYDIDPAAQTGEETGERSMQQSYLQMSFGLTEPMEAGEVAGPLQVGEQYFVLKIAEKTVPTEEETKELAQEKYRHQVQASYAEARLNEMVETQTVEKIGDAWDTMEVFH